MGEESNKKDKFADLIPPISFAPHRWGQIQKFINFYSPTYQFNQNVESTLYGAIGHFTRYVVLRGLCLKLVPELVKDYEELVQNGYSNNVHSHELAAIVDNLFCELYSSVDCTRTVIASVYNKHNYVPSGSTSKMFKYASENKMDERVPLKIRKALADGYNDWFQRLKEIRDAINHSSVGICTDLEGRMKGELEPKIAYVHISLGNELGNLVVTHDVFKLISDFEVKVNHFLGTIYYALNLTLKDTETTQDCGFFNNLVYQRFVSPHKAINSHSGRCMSREYFEKGDMPVCPYVKTCGAYLNSEGESYIEKSSEHLDSTPQGYLL